MADITEIMYASNNSNFNESGIGISDPNMTVFHSNGDCTLHVAKGVLTTYDVIQDVFYVVLTPAVSLFGCFGNILNIIALIRSRQRMKKADGGRDSGTLIGLLVLAVSDMLFCLTIFPRAFAKISGNEALFHPNDFRLYYQVYGTGVINTFILTSTWITVSMALMRYIGICHPLATRKIDSNICVRFTYFIIAVICIIINLPMFWQYKITDFTDPRSGCTWALIDIGYFAISTTLGYSFLWFRAIIGILLPALLLVYTNWSLIQALRRSRRMRRECRVQNSVNRSSNRITLLLIVIVLLFIVLVFPAEILDFCQAVILNQPENTSLFLVIRGIANFMQVVNFSCNFVLYCALNVHFRKTMKELLTCTFGEIRRRQSFNNSTASRTEKPGTTRQVWL